VYRFPPLDRTLKFNTGWASTLDTLRVPRRPDQKLADWRREAPVRPVVFKDTGVLTEDTVHLHLDLRVAQRLLARFRAQGYIEQYSGGPNPSAKVTSAGASIINMNVANVPCAGSS
jgi:hypothetical protein